MSPSYKLIGTPFSTFTRTIALGLHYKQVPFEQIATTPHSSIARAHHPFGLLPSLVIEYEGHSESLSESQAIARYIERTAPNPSLELPKESWILDEKIWEFVSLVSSFAFTILEGGVIKPYVMALDDGKEDTFKYPYGAISTAKDCLTKLEARMLPNTRFAFGDEPTWADFFLYPQLADLRAVPAWSKLQSERLVRWMEAMDGLEAAERTVCGTLEADGRP